MLVDKNIRASHGFILLRTKKNCAKVRFAMSSTWASLSISTYTWDRKGSILSSLTSQFSLKYKMELVSCPCVAMAYNNTHVNYP
jgi:hypothetical protein